MAPDIVAKIEADFVATERDQAYAVLQSLESERKSTGHERILRCVLFLARGDIAQLRQKANNARHDFRDVILWAEYDENNCRLRDFNRPFAGTRDNAGQPPI